MSITVEHEKRRSDILVKALNVFSDEGFENTTFQKIADRCSITRTTLYTYFKNKKEIFNFSIRQFLQTLENSIIEIKKETGLSSVEKLTLVMTVILKHLEENRRLFSVILDYLVNASRGEPIPICWVLRRTVRLRHIHTSLIIEGIKSGELSPSIRVKDANEMFYGLIEAAIMRLAVLKHTSVGELADAMKQAVERLAAP